MSTLLSVDERSATDRIHEALSSAQGIVDTLVGPLLFLILVRTVGRDAALIGAGAAPVPVVTVRLGLPRTAALVAITLLVIRRSLGPRGRPPASEPLQSPPHA